jgi:hypothetical protein
VPQNFLDLVSNTNTHAARTRTGAHEARDHMGAKLIFASMA